MINIQDLKFTYDQQQTHHIINIPSWHIKAKENIFITGQSGSGKSTLIHLLSGLLQASSGSITINGTELAQLNMRKKNKFRAQNIGLISQNFNLIPYLSVLDNIRLANSFADKRTLGSLNNIKRLMSQLNLKQSLLHRTSSQLSFGQQQRVAIIRALINNPKLILADEPTSALDQTSKMNFIETLQTLTEQYEMTLLFISHDVSIKSFFKQTVDIETINVI